MARPNDLICRRKNGTFDVYVQIQDGTEYCGNHPTLKEAVERFIRSSKCWNHYVPPLEEVTLGDWETRTSCSVAEGMEDKKMKQVKAKKVTTKPVPEKDDDDLDLEYLEPEGTFTVYKLSFKASNGLHIHAGASGIFYLVPDCSKWPGVKHLLFGKESIGSFGQPKLALVTYQPSIDGAIEAIKSPEAAFGSENVSWRVLRQFEVKESDIENLASRASEAYKAEQQFEFDYKQFEKQNECYRVVLGRSRRGPNSAPIWDWFAHIPELPKIGKPLGSKGRLDATEEFQTQEEAKKDWLRVAAEKGITDFEVDVAVFS